MIAFASESFPFGYARLTSTPALAAVTNNAAAMTAPLNFFVILFVIILPCP